MSAEPGLDRCPELDGETDRIGGRGNEMKREEVRRTVIVALAADDELGELLVLKGGNALGLVHQIGDRASLDVDYSIEGDFEDTDEVRRRIDRALQAEFQRHGLRAFDVRMGVKPELGNDPDLRPMWGGWAVEFKLVTLQNWTKYESKPQKRRHVALSLDGDKKAFQIDISKFEFVERAQTVEFEGYDLRVYSPAMIVYEKLRALCQQLPEYPPVTHPRPRPRDFVDIAVGRSAVGSTETNGTAFACLSSQGGADVVVEALVGTQSVRLP